MEAARQLDMLLLAPAPNARASDPDTSVRAANQCTQARGKDRLAVLCALYRAHPLGLTDFQLGERLKRKQTSVGKRRGELRDSGLVKDSGTRRPSDTGSSAIVWCLTEEGAREARKLLII